MSRRFLLLPSPVLGGARFYLPLANQLRDLGASASIINIVGESNAAMIASAAQQAHRAAGDGEVVLVAYSGAGPLVPGVVAGFQPGHATVVFLDATLPHPGQSRLAELRESLPPETFDALDALLRSGGTWPDWTDEQLAPLLPHREVRSAILASVTARPRSFFEELLPPDRIPPGLPCAYVRLSPAYDRAQEGATSSGWPAGSLDLTHFGPYTDAGPIARTLLAIAEQVGTDEGRF